MKLQWLIVLFCHKDGDNCRLSNRGYVFSKFYNSILCHPRDWEDKVALLHPRYAWDKINTQMCITQRPRLHPTQDVGNHGSTYTQSGTPVYRSLSTPLNWLSIRDQHRSPGAHSSCQLVRYQTEISKPRAWEIRLSAYSQPSCWHNLPSDWSSTRKEDQLFSVAVKTRQEAAKEDPRGPPRGSTLLSTWAHVKTMQWSLTWQFSMWHYTRP